MQHNQNFSGEVVVMQIQIFSILEQMADEKNHKSLRCLVCAEHVRTCISVTQKHF